MILSEFGIKSTKICNRKIRGFDIFSFYIRGIDDFLIFKKIVGFIDINKNKKLTVKNFLLILNSMATHRLQVFH
jgi:hypothetical protein